nr:immunoglobulin light chain junction region [Macaca mulatta]MOV75159.1 immunoglobulin light chain junction region [Macaca mulatta]MOV76155.1 immunoglobulin light chain junction region [Macaca mulatta]MOV76459.1 immunoglobulin light chain junction region [Macaca mulatta]MOV77219.1 immunoglobulin light chain junction region [Macaca mulatta]
CQQHNNYPPTF